MNRTSVAAARAEILAQLASMIEGIEASHPVRVAVDGVDGAGKTRLADELGFSLESLGRQVIRASVDGFHNPRDVRYKRGLDSPEGYFRDSFQYGAILSELLYPFGPEGSLSYRPSIYDVRTEKFVDMAPRLARPDAILIFDGIFLMCPELYPHWEFKIFVEVDLEIALHRALSRDTSRLPDQAGVSALRRRYLQRYLPGQQIYLEEIRPKEKVDVILDNYNLAYPTLYRR